ncbi:MAG: hypothetical protein U0X91_19075 [Spirosomataceae bacterium]
MKSDDELKEFLGGMFHDFESEPHPQAWERIESALLKTPFRSTWPKVVTGALIGLFCAGVAHAPVHSQLARNFPKLKAEKAASVLASNLFGENTAAGKRKTILKTADKDRNRVLLKSEQKEIIAEPTVNRYDGEAYLHPSSEALSEPAPKSLPLLLEAAEINALKELPVSVAESKVETPRPVLKRAGFVKLWSVSVMPLATYQRMYIASEQIQQIQLSEPLNSGRTGMRIGTELTLLRDRSAWRFGLSYTQMRRQTNYTLGKNTYTLNTSSNLNEPAISQQVEQVRETAEWHLLGVRADRQYQLATVGKLRYYVSLGTEGAVELTGRQPYLWGHASVGVQKLLTPHVWMSVEPTASYSLISRTATNGLLRVNPYNFGVKISLGIMP